MIRQTAGPCLRRAQEYGKLGQRTGGARPHARQTRRFRTRRSDSDEARNAPAARGNCSAPRVRGSAPRRRPAAPLPTLSVFAAAKLSSHQRHRQNRTRRGVRRMERTLPEPEPAFFKAAKALIRPPAPRPCVRSPGLARPARVPAPPIRALAHLFTPAV